MGHTLWGKMRDMSDIPISNRAQRWAATMGGYEGASDDVTVAHQDSNASVGPFQEGRPSLTGPLRQREELLDALMTRGATRSDGGGHRLKEEGPDEFRTCFERDRDRILHSSASVSYTHLTLPTSDLV